MKKILFTIFVLILVGITFCYTEYYYFDYGGIQVNTQKADSDSVISGDNETNLFYVDAGNDRIGIGTSSPGGELHIDTDTTYADLVLEGDRGGQISFSDDGVAEFYIYNNADDDLIFYRNAATNLVLDTTGKVGIGTSSPDTLFQCSLGASGVGTSAATVAKFERNGSVIIQLASPAANSGNIYFGDAADINAGQITYDHSTNDLGFFSNGSATANMVVDTTGNIGIGTSSPSYQLELSTDSAGKPSTNTWTISSDERIKTNIKTMENALTKITSLRGVTFEYNDVKYPELQGKKQRGLIAQEVQKVIPEWVGADDDGYLNLKIGGFEGLVAEAMKELVLKIEKLENRIKELESK